MCVIVDVNIAPRVLLTAGDPNFGNLYRSLVEGAGPRAVMLYGGHLTVEYRRNRALAARLALLDRAGRARHVPDAKVIEKAREIKERGLCVSDDPHIVALALIGGARVLCSDDKNLCEDFGNSELIKKPKGKIYKNATHNHLLRRGCAL